ncbi:Exosome complex exonuclease RRP46 [Gryllus bimaculatus]|nr:Exosome complex exonuclease RRP46 [Gryllus bimaculatus]
MEDTAIFNVQEQWLRPLRCELNVLSRPDGSAMITQGNTAVVAAVYGPVDVKPQRILVDKASIETVYKPKSGLPNVADRMRETIIKNTCETALLSAIHPRTAVCIVLQEMQDSGGLLSCCINAACMALMDSGIAMKFLVAAGSKASLTFVFDSAKKNLVASHTSGVFSQEQYHESLLKCRQASCEIFEFYRSLVKKYIICI